MALRLENSVAVYMDDISSFPVMSRDEEQEAFRQLARKSPGARERIVQSNLRFVVKIALSYQGRGLPLSDLIQEGNLGLLEVIERFDPSRGFRFSTYAAFWIRQAIQLALRRKANLVRIPVRKARQIDQVRGAIHEARAHTGIDPDMATIAENANLSEREIVELIHLREPAVPLESDHTDPDSGNLLDTLSEEGARQIEERILEDETRRHIARVLDTLTPRERNILELRYGLRDDQSRSLREVSRMVGLSQEGVRRIERRAFDKIRRNEATEPLTQCA